LQKRLFQIKTAITFAYGLKKHIIYEKLSTQNFTSDFNRLRPFGQFLVSQNSKGKYESRKNLDFARKNDFFWIFSFLLLFLLLFGYFEVFLINFGILEFFDFFEYFEFKN
jgi:hypothetical protein